MWWLLDHRGRVVGRFGGCRGVGTRGDLDGSLARFRSHEELVRDLLDDEVARERLQRHLNHTMQDMERMRREGHERHERSIVLAREA